MSLLLELVNSETLPEVPRARSRLGLVTLPGFTDVDDPRMYWAPVYWLCVGPLVFCLRSWRRGRWGSRLRVFVSPKRAVNWGLEV